MKGQVGRRATPPRIAIVDVQRIVTVGISQLRIVVQILAEHVAMMMIAHDTVER